jgi:hypothetical protein
MTASAALHRESGRTAVCRQAMERGYNAPAPGKLPRLHGKAKSLHDRGSAITAALRTRTRRVSRPRLAVASHPILEGAELLDPDRPARVHPAGGDPDFGPEAELAAWQDHRNKRHAKANWQFTTDDARVKLKRRYPSI